MKHWVLNFSQSVHGHACLSLIYFIYLSFHLIWGLHWHDVGEWISASWMLAPAHPPSHPPLAHLGRRSQNLNSVSAS